MSQPQVSRTHARQPRSHPAIWVMVTVLLAAALVAVLWVPFYDRTTPTLANFPFFYWYQLLWVPIVAILGGLAYVLTRSAQRGSGIVTRPHASPAGPGQEEEKN
jgi:Protein of unknown function (DUF3311)